MTGLYRERPVAKKKGERLNWIMTPDQRRRKAALLARERAYRRKKKKGG